MERSLPNAGVILSGKCTLALLAHAFATRGAARVITGTAADNLPSCRLLARLGFTRSGESLVSFHTDASGAPITFLGYTFELSREAWERGAGGK